MNYKIIDVPIEFQPIINVEYPPNNKVEFERWFYYNFKGCKTEREYLPVFWCAYQVNHGYGKDELAMARLQKFVDQLPNDKKYFTISQYDDSVGVDFKDKDVLIFDMSKTGENRYPLPLIGQPHPYVFNEEKKYIANFVGNITHPIREHAKTLIGKEGYYISFDRHSPEDYCRIISQSKFTLCYRGYGLNSFRIAEALQYGSIPVYISDEFIHIHNINFFDYGHKINKFTIKDTEKILSAFTYVQKDHLVKHGKEVYQNYFTYEGTFDKIIKHLEIGK